MIKETEFANILIACVNLLTAIITLKTVIRTQKLHKHKKKKK